MVLASPCCLPLWGCQEPSEWYDSEDIDKAVSTELLLLSNPLYGDGNGVSGGQSPWSLLSLLQFWPLEGHQGDSVWYEVESPGMSLQGESPHWSNLNGCGVNRFTCGCLGPSPLSSIRLWPRQSPANLLEWLRGLWHDRLAYQPMCPPLLV